MSVNANGSSSNPSALSHTRSTEPDHSARAAVFGTNELVHHILLQLPVEDRERARRVSKTFNHVITKLGYAIQPADSHIKNYDEYPIYPNRLNIRLNPIMTKDGPLTCPPSSGFTRMTTVRVPWRYAPELREFLTYPPITQVSVRYRPLAYSATIRVRDGVRVEDVVEVLEKMRALAPRNLGPRRPEPIALYRTRDFGEGGSGDTPKI
jgi:hypothetical protein